MLTPKSQILMKIWENITFLNNEESENQVWNVIIHLRITFSRLETLVLRFPFHHAKFQAFGFWRAPLWRSTEEKLTPKGTGAIRETTSSWSSPRAGLIAKKQQVHSLEVLARCLKKRTLFRYPRLLWTFTNKYVYFIQCLIR